MNKVFSFGGIAPLDNSYSNKTQTHAKKDSWAHDDAASDEQTPQKDHPGINLPNKFGISNSKMSQGAGAQASRFNGASYQKHQEGSRQNFKGLQSSRASSTAQLLFNKQMEPRGDKPSNLGSGDLMTQILLNGGSLKDAGAKGPIKANGNLLPPSQLTLMKA